MKSYKCMDINVGGAHLECVFVKAEERRNPYRVFLKPDCYHRAQIAKYGDWLSVVYFIRDFFMDGMNTRTREEVRTWAKEHGSI